jgi:hypothetical protein
VTDWTQFADLLAEQLAVLPSGAILKLVKILPDQYQFVEFAQDDDSLYADMTGDTYLEPGYRPTPQGRQEIIDVGWQIPDADHVDNWWIQLPWPLTTSIYHYIATMSVTGLRDGFGIHSPAELVYDAWNTNNRNDPMDLPLLGLDRSFLR